MLGLTRSRNRTLAGRVVSVVCFVALVCLALLIVSMPVGCAAQSAQDNVLIPVIKEEWNGTRPEEGLKDEAYDGIQYRVNNGRYSPERANSRREKLIRMNESIDNLGQPPVPVPSPATEPGRVH